MAYEGTLINGAMVIIGATLFLFVAVKVYLEKREKKEVPVIALFFLLSGVYLSLVGTRQFFAYAGRFDIDKALFLILAPFFAYSAAPLVYLAVYLLSGAKRLSIWISVSVAFLASVGLFFLYAGGITALPMSEWGSDYAVNSPVTRVLILIVYLLAGLVSSVILFGVGRKCDDAQVRYRLVGVGLSCLIFFTVNTVDAFAVSGAAMLVVRVLIMISALVAYLAYFPPKGLEKIVVAHCSGKAEAPEVAPEAER